MKLLGISTDDLHNPPMVRAFVFRLTTFLAGLTLAVVVGYWVGSGQTFYLTCLIAISVLILVVFGMQRKAWILIPLTWILVGSISKLPVPFAVRDLGVMLATTSYVAYRVLSQSNLRPKLHILDLLVGLNLVYLAFTLYVNPVGFAIFGSQTIGARPILNISIAVMAYWVLIRLPNSTKEVSRIPYYMLAAASLLSAVNLLVFIVPSTGPRIYSWYSELDLMPTSVAVSYQGIQRLFGLKHIGFYLSMVLCAYSSPIKLFNPRRPQFYALLFALVCILATGFRNLLLWAMAALVIGGLLYRRWRELVVAGLCGALLLGVLAYGQGRFYQLPNTVQRSLAFLPGQWSENVVNDAEGSSTWRFTLWQRIIEEGIIKNWWFGDGFGANIQDLIVAHSIQGGYNDFITLTGAFHSGPLTAIRYVGVSGLVFLYLLSISAAFYSYRCVQQCRGTILFPVAVFFAIQLIWGPIHYTLVFGGYDAYLPDLFFQVGCLRLLIRISDEWKQKAAMKMRPEPVPVPAPAAAIA
jgi:hypothetical protein